MSGPPAWPTSTTRASRSPRRPSASTASSRSSTPTTATPAGHALRTGKLEVHAAHGAAADRHPDARRPRRRRRRRRPTTLPTTTDPTLAPDRTAPQLALALKFTKSGTFAVRRTGKFRLDRHTQRALGPDDHRHHAQEQEAKARTILTTTRKGVAAGKPHVHAQPEAQRPRGAAQEPGRDGHRAGARRRRERHDPHRHRQGALAQPPGMESSSVGPGWPAKFTPATWPPELSTRTGQLGGPATPPRGHGDHARVDETVTAVDDLAGDRRTAPAVGHGERRRTSDEQRPHLTWDRRQILRRLPSGGQSMLAVEIARGASARAPRHPENLPGVRDLYRPRKRPGDRVGYDARRDLRAECEVLPHERAGGAPAVSLAFGAPRAQRRAQYPGRRVRRGASRCPAGRSAPRTRRSACRAPCSAVGPVAPRRWSNRRPTSNP